MGRSGENHRIRMPLVFPLAADPPTALVALDAALAALEKLTPAMRLDGHAAEARELEVRIHLLSTELAAGVDHFLAQGIEIKSLDHGLIDFPSPRGDMIVYLCWRLGEGPRIQYWHEIDTGFAGRKKLES